MNILYGAVTAEKEENIGTDATKEQWRLWEDGRARLAAEGEKCLRFEQRRRCETFV